MAHIRLDNATLLRLIERAYEAGQQPAAWSACFGELSASLDARSALVVRHDLRGQGRVFENVGVDPDALALYNAHFHAVDAWALGARGMAGAGRALPDESLIGRAELQKTEFYADFASRFDTSRMVTLTLGFDGQQSALSLHRRERDRPYSTRELRFLEALAPHLARALSVHERLSTLEMERSALLHGLDALACAVVLADGTARVLHCNRKGAALQAARDGIGVSGGRLVTSTVAGTQRLRELCASAAGLAPGTALHGGPLLVQRPGLTGPALQVLVAPSVPGASPEGIPRQRAALVFIHDPLDDRSPREALLQHYYGMTRGEAYIAARLALGRSLDQIAHERGVTIETVRGYAKQVLGKLGARSRAEAVRRLTRSLASLDGET